MHPALFELDNVSLTPHIGTATVETRAYVIVLQFSLTSSRKMEGLVLANVEAVLDGKLPLTPVPECSGLKV